MLSDGHRQVTYDDQDRPETITMDGIVTTTFRYTPDGDRYLQRTTSTADASVARTIFYVDKDYERVEWDQKAAEEKTYCGKSVVVERSAGLTPERQIRYVHGDRLGSVDVATNEDATEITDEAHGYDAFGRPRDRNWEPSQDRLHPNGEWGTTTNHGFTTHEHLDETYLIHMNGRVYDYRLGRFLSVDPIIADPVSSQSINAYSYGGNNPLSGIDPSGYAFFTDGGGANNGLCKNESGPCNDGKATAPEVNKPITAKGAVIIIQQNNGQMSLVGIYHRGTDAGMDNFLGPTQVGGSTTNGTMSDNSGSLPRGVEYKVIRGDNIAGSAVETGGRTIGDMTYRPEGSSGQLIANGEERRALDNVSKESPDIAALRTNDHHLAVFMNVSRAEAKESGFGGGALTNVEPLPNGWSLSITRYNLQAAQEFSEKYPDHGTVLRWDLDKVIAHELGHVVQRLEDFAHHQFGDSPAQRNAGERRAIINENFNRDIGPYRSLPAP